ncbi:GmrSD restriction endonuclease domain-containing protein [Cronobacter malonaticus]
MPNENLDIDSRTTEQLYDWFLKGNLIVNRRYQRKLVWSLEEKTSLISSMLQQYPIPLLLFVTINEQREILDGMQRLEAIMSFIEQRFTLNGQYFDLDSIALTKELKDNGTLTQKKPVLSRESSATIARYRFAISEYSSTDANIDEVFRRINSNGKILSKQELRSAGTVSNFSELVRSISTAIRGDTSHSDIMNLKQMHKISISNDRLEYGVNIDNHFYIKHHILTRRSIRDSADEELIANILAYISLEEKPTSGSTSLDTFYGQGNSSHAQGLRQQLENYIQTNNANSLKQNFIAVYELITTLYEGKNETFRSHILGDENSSQECPRYYQAVFLAIYDLIFNKNMQLSDKDGLFEQLKNTGNSVIIVTDGGRWAASTREKSVNDLIAMITRYFKPAPQRYVNHAWITEIRNLLTNSRTEQPSYDFKQGFFNLSGDHNFDDGCLKGILQTCVAINNIGKSAKGYILVGIAETKATAERIQQLYGVSPIEFNGFYINGIDHEAMISSGSIDDYFMLIKQKIQEYNFTETLKQQLLKNIEFCSYSGLHILKIEIQSTGEVCDFENQFYIRQGSSTEPLTDAQQISALFKTYMNN